MPFKKRVMRKKVKRRKSNHQRTRSRLKEPTLEFLIRQAKLLRMTLIRRTVNLRNRRLKLLVRSRMSHGGELMNQNSMTYKSRISLQLSKPNPKSRKPSKESPLRKKTMVTKTKIRKAINHQHHIALLYRHVKRLKLTHLLRRKLKRN